MQSQTAWPAAEMDIHRMTSWIEPSVGRVTSVSNLQDAETPDDLVWCWVAWYGMVTQAVEMEARDH